MTRRVVLTLLVAVTVCSVVVVACGSREKTPIRIGVQAPLTGEWSKEGEAMLRAAQLLAEQVNAEGGLIDGRPVEIVEGDTRGDREVARRMAERLVGEDLKIVMGSYSSDAAETSSEVYHREGMLFVASAANANRLSERGYPYFFRVCFPNDRQGLFVADFIVNTLGLNRAALVHDGSIFADELAKWARIYLDEQGAEVVLDIIIEPGQRDFTTLLDKLGESDVEVIYFSGYYPDAGVLVKQLRQVEALKDVKFIGGNAVNNPEFINIAGVQAAMGSFVVTAPLPQDLDSPEAEKFKADYQERYGEPPVSIWTLMAADTFRVLKHAIEEANSTEVDVLTEYIRGMKDFSGITGTIIGFDENGDRIGTPYVPYVVNEAGEFVLYQP